MLKTIFTKKIIVGISTLILFAVVFVGCHDRWGHGNLERRAEWVVEEITDELELSDSQQMTLNRIKGEILAKKKEKLDDQTMFTTLIDETAKDHLDQERIRQAMHNKRERMGEMTEFVMEKYFEFHQILTPEQRVKAAKKMKKAHDRRMKWRGKK